MKATIGTAVLSACLAFGATSTSAAQEPQAPNVAPQNNIGDSDLRAFAKAYIESEKIRSEYGPRFNSANSPQEKGAVEQEAVTKFSKAVESEGLTMQQYSALYQTVSIDPQLRARVLQLVEEERGKS
ncbi:MAG: DUF4168 domain-containing protein [Candidatus Binatia bacterium]